MPIPAIGKGIEIRIQRRLNETGYFSASATGGDLK